MAVVRALEMMGDTRARGALRRQLDRETDGRVARRIREALRDLAAGPSAEHKRMSDELEQVKRDLAELKTRLAKAERKAHKKRAHARKSG